MRSDRVLDTARDPPVSSPPQVTITSEQRISPSKHGKANLATARIPRNCHLKFASI